VRVRGFIERFSSSMYCGVSPFSKLINSIPLSFVICVCIVQYTICELVAARFRLLFSSQGRNTESPRHGVRGSESLRVIRSSGTDDIFCLRAEWCASVVFLSNSLARCIAACQPSGRGLIRSHYLFSSASALYTTRYVSWSQRAELAGRLSSKTEIRRYFCVWVEGCAPVAFSSNSLARCTAVGLLQAN